MDADPPAQGVKIARRITHYGWRGIFATGGALLERFFEEARRGDVVGDVRRLAQRQYHAGYLKDAAQAESMQRLPNRRKRRHIGALDWLVGGHGVARAAPAPGQTFPVAWVSRSRTQRQAEPFADGEHARNIAIAG